MSHPQSTVVNVNGVNKVFYSEEYVKELCKQSYKNGFFNSARPEIHFAISEEADENYLKKLVNKFFEIVNQRYKEHFTKIYHTPFTPINHNF